VEHNRFLGAQFFGGPAHARIAAGKAQPTQPFIDLGSLQFGVFSVPRLEEAPVRSDDSLDNKARIPALVPYGAGDRTTVQSQMRGDLTDRELLGGMELQNVGSEFGIDHGTLRKGYRVPA